MSPVYYALVGIVSLAIILYIYFYQKFNYWKRRNIPGPKPLPFFGNIKDSALRKENACETFRKIYEQFPDEPVVGMYRMTSPCILVRDLDVIKHIMIKDFDIFEDRGVEFSKEGLGANLFHADGETWRVLRNKFTPMFSTSKLKVMFYLVVEQSDKFMKYFENIVKEQPEQEVYAHFKRYTISTIMACAFGMEVDTVSESLMETLYKIDKLTLKTHFLHEVDMMFPGLLKKIGSSLFPLEVNKFFLNIVSKVIKERNGKPSNRNDFMDLILDLKQKGEVVTRHDIKKADNSNLSVKLTESLIAAQAFVFYVAGYETSASVLSFMLYELAKQPKIQDKVLKEIDDVLQKHGGKLTYDTLSDLSYVERVFHETYRKYPIVPIQRKANADYTIPGTNITIEKDMMILLSPPGIHYDEKYYPNPEVFDPDRFTIENSKDRHPCAYIPYGVGPRNCIGIRFGKLQTRALAVKLLSKYRVELSEKTTTVTIDPERLLLNPLGGIYLNIIPRNA